MCLYCAGSSTVLLYCTRMDEWVFRAWFGSCSMLHVRVFFMRMLGAAFSLILVIAVLVDSTPPPFTACICSRCTMRRCVDVSMCRCAYGGVCLPLFSSLLSSLLSRAYPARGWTSPPLSFDLPLETEPNQIKIAEGTSASCRWPSP